MGTTRDADLTFPHVQRIRASAGSGKTYALALRYLQFLLSDRIPQSALPNLLAVTFTNKATAEMMGRILQWLKILHFGPSDPKEETVFRDLAASLSAPEEDLSSRALDALQGIFADHLDFSVGTIDSFLSGLARGSAYELGLPPGAEIVVDGGPAVQEALGLLLDRAGQDGALSADLAQAALDLLDLSEDFTWDLRGRLIEEIRAMRALEIRSGLPFVRAEGLQEARRAAQEEAISAASALQRLVVAAEIRLRSDLVGKLGEFLGNRRLASLSEATALKKDALVDSALKASKERVTPSLETAFGRLKGAAAELALATARAHPEPYLRLLGRVDALMDEIAARDSALLLDRVPFLLRTFLDDVGVPAAYFTWGERLRHFLVDEFQDTSESQWACLKPLVEEALAQEGSLFFVGDRKQAIYGFRGGRAGLFDDVLEAFSCDFRDDELTKNWRSRRVLVEYHREAFSGDNLREWLTGVAGTKEDPFTPEDYERAIAPVFQGAAQEWNREGGYLRVERRAVPAGTSKEVLQEELVGEIAEGILPDLRARGFAERDICILVRKNEEAALASRVLLARGVQVASASTLTLAASQVARELVALLAFLNSPVDDLSFVTFAGGEVFARASGLAPEAVFSALVGGGPAGDGRALYTRFRERFPGEWESLVAPHFKAVGYQPPYDLLQEIVAGLRVTEHFTGEAAFVAHLLGLVKAREEKGENSVGAFLDFWNDNPEDPALRVPLAEEADAVRVMTIHKAKGLEFPAVILPFPYLEPPRISSVVVREGDVLRPLRLAAACAALSPELAALKRMERLRQVAEELNAFYVALTRAADELYVFLPEVDGKAPSRKKALPFPLPEEVVLDERGDKVTREPAAARPVTFLEGRDRSDRWRNKLHLRERGFPGTRDPEARPAVERGKLVHRVLASGAKSPEAIEAFLASAHAPAQVRRDAKGILRALLADARIAPLVAPPEGAVVQSEVTLLDGKGGLHTADRLIFGDGAPGGRITAVEWKTGARYPEEHREQISTYCRLLCEAYPGREVRGVLVYVDEAAAEEVLWSV